MAIKVTIVCAVVCLVQSITSQPINIASPSILTTGQLNNAASSNSVNSGQLINTINSGQLINTINSGQVNTASPNSGLRSGILTVTSTSPIYPAGLSVYAENIVLEGPLAVAGQVPFLGTIGFEGSLDTAGQGVATCGCGDGNIGIINEGLAGRR